LSAQPAVPRVSVTLHADGRDVRVPAGITVAAALLELGVRGFRTSVSGEPRAPLCGMGTCYECRVTIDGIPHRRSCLMMVSEGMRVDTAAGERVPE
jgi:sarcosine oxidase subunit alpha